MMMTQRYFKGHLWIRSGRTGMAVRPNMAILGDPDDAEGGELLEWYLKWLPSPFFPLFIRFHCSAFRLLLHIR